MWPYDNFHQVSAIEIDEKLGFEKPIFISIWFGGENKNIKLKQQKKIALIKKIVANLKIDKVNFLPVVERRSGEIFSKIQEDIIKSTFVICDLSPREDRSETEFCDNVLLELGLAMAWKMEEQVIILWDEQGCRKKFNYSEQLPSDFKTHYVYRIDSANDKFGEKLTKIIKERYTRFEYRKDIFIKNAKCKLDRIALQFLKSKDGLLFSNPPIDVISISTLRHLLSLGIIQTVVYRNNWTFSYKLTKFGRIILEQEIGAELFPEILVDMQDVRYFYYDHTNRKGDFIQKLKHWENGYKKIYGDDLTFWNSIRRFNEFIPEGAKAQIIQEFKEENKKRKIYKKRKQLKDNFELDLFSRYLERTSRASIKKDIFPDWEKSIGRLGVSKKT